MQTLLTFTLLQPPELPSPPKCKQGSTELALLRSGGRGGGDRKNVQGETQTLKFQSWSYNLFVIS